MEHIKTFLREHPVEAVLLGGVAVIALYYAFAGGNSAAQQQANQSAQLEQDYFQAEGIQAQSNAAVQVAQIQSSAQTAQTQIAANVSTTNATTYANEQEAITSDNDQAAVSALPYSTEDQLIGTLGTIAGQTSTTTSQSSSSGFFGIGGGSSSSTTTQPTIAAENASSYLTNELVNGLYATNG